MTSFRRGWVRLGLAGRGWAGPDQARPGEAWQGKARRPPCGETQGGRYIVFNIADSSSPRNEFGAWTPSLSQSWLALTT
jgi:hypothetical protein